VARPRHVSRQVLIRSLSRSPGERGPHVTHIGTPITLPAAGDRGRPMAWDDLEGNPGRRPSVHKVVAHRPVDDTPQDRSHELQRMGADGLLPCDAGKHQEVMDSAFGLGAHRPRSTSASPSAQTRGLSPKAPHSESSLGAVPADETGGRMIAPFSIAKRLPLASRAALARGPRPGAASGP
jgi:hypothetical protein